MYAYFSLYLRYIIIVLLSLRSLRTDQQTGNERVRIGDSKPNTNLLGYETITLHNSFMYAQITAVLIYITLKNQSTQ